MTLCENVERLLITTEEGQGGLTFLYSSRVMQPSLSVSYMLNRTEERTEDYEIFIIKLHDLTNGLGLLMSPRPHHITTSAEF